jgi:plasmid maintenance system antidote protein VapI
MELNLPKKWFEKHIIGEGEVDIGAGHPSMCAFFKNESIAEQIEPLEEALGVLVNFKRREMGMSIEELAKAARVDTVEIRNIECHGEHNINPRTIHQLATVFKLPTKALLKLSGSVDVYDDDLVNEAMKFAARSEKIATLNRIEKKLLSEFVNFLSSKKMD